MKWLAASLIALGVFATAASAQTVNPCVTMRMDLDAIPEPWSENTKSFSEGRVRLAVFDTIEPAAAAYHLIVLSPPRDEFGARICRIVSVQNSIGFGGIFFNDISARYLAGVGLVFEIPVKIVAGDGTATQEVLQLKLNQQTGALSAELKVLE